jgi:uncharacterized membrane protein
LGDELLVEDESSIENKPLTAVQFEVSTGVFKAGLEDEAVGAGTGPDCEVSTEVSKAGLEGEAVGAGTWPDCEPLRPNKVRTESQFL